MRSACRAPLLACGLLPPRRLPSAALPAGLPQAPSTAARTARATGGPRDVTEGATTTERGGTADRVNIGPAYYPAGVATGRARLIGRTPARRRAVPALGAGALPALANVGCNA